MRPAAAILVGIAPLIVSCGDSRPAAEPVRLPANRASAPASLPTASGRELVAQLGCAGCHPGVGAANEARGHSPPLADIGARRSPGYIFAYLADPSRGRSGDGRARMPDFHLDERERLALTLYLSTLRDNDARVERLASGTLSRDESRALDDAFERARESYPEVTTAVGERISASLDCAACHALPGATRWLAGPDLAAEGSRVKIDWLRAFLMKPSAIRPFGSYVGSGSRMPDFHLSEDEVDSLVAHLATMRTDLPPTDTEPTLSVFREREIESLLSDRLPCLGCHRMGDDGGRIAPDLSIVGARLQPAYIGAIMTDPRHTVPGTIMPRVPIPPREAGRIVAYLIALDSSGTPPGDSARAGYLSLVDNAPTLPTATDDAAALYGRICSNCHGRSGGGDGWNAAYLPVRPTAHSDASYMSTRSDHTLYDGIAAGGYILARSNRMPPFGEMLSSAQIDSLVRYVRKLCKCEAPAWSRDGAHNGVQR
ncbi:MAG TPA: c-type cytochrome [Gemmatimonadaceae bacterium]|nr:c-type cytochrome [Gemmatimonadaceae bacterium]